MFELSDVICIPKVQDQNFTKPKSLRTITFMVNHIVALNSEQNAWSPYTVRFVKFFPHFIGIFYE